MAVNCRVYLRDVKHSPDASYDEKKRDEKEAFDGMLSAFRSKTTDCRIIPELKRREFFESKGERRRRKIKENRRYKFKNKPY